MIKLIQDIKTMFSPPSAETIALHELEEAKRELLKAQSMNEYAAKMAEYHQGKIKRLTAYLKAAMKEHEVVQSANQ